MSEHRGFVSALIFIVIFGAFVATIPVDLQGTGGTGDTIIPIDPSLVSDFAESEQYNRTDFGGIVYPYYYEYDMNGYSWMVTHTATVDFTLGAKVLIGGILWFGAMSYCSFKSPDNVDRGTTLSIAEIEADAENGVVRYTLTFDNGNDAGAFVAYWNTTTYSDPEDAWDNDELCLLHGIGITANTNIASLLLGLLFLQLPDCPLLISLLIATPLWANIIFVIWYIIKEMIPFL